MKISCPVFLVVLLLSSGVVVDGRAQSSLEGRVVHATTSAPVSSVMVELHRVTEAGGGLTDSVRVDPEGNFRFELLAGSEPEGSTVWIAAARYEGVLYFGPPVHAGMSTDDLYQIAVYDTVTLSEPAADLVTGMRHVVVSAIADHGGVIQVAEIVDISNEGPATYVGDDPSAVLWRMPLPAGAMQGSVLEGGLPADAVVFEEGSVGLMGTLPPPGVRLAIQYVVPSDELELEVAHPTENLDVLADQGGGPIEVMGLDPGEAPEIPGSVILRFAGQDLDVGARIQVRVSSPRVPSRGAAWIWLLAAGILVVAAIVSSRLRFESRAA